MPHTFLLILVLGLFAQYVDGVLGMGYGATSSAFLISAGFLPALVSASVHTAEIFSSFVSGVSHLKFGNVDWRIALPLTGTGALGGVIGAYILTRIPGETVKPLVALLLLVLGIRIFVRFLVKNRGVSAKREFSQAYLLGLGFTGGVVDAVGGGGWGPICTSTLVAANRTEPRYVIGSVNLAEFFTTSAIVGTFAVTLGFEAFLWQITIPLIIGGVMIAPVAAYTCGRISQTILGAAVGTIIVVLNTRTIAGALPKVVGVQVSVSPESVAVSVLIVLIAIVVGRAILVKRVPEDSSGDVSAAGQAGVLGGVGETTGLRQEE
jgi:uncharacterized membrane protein YfcA